MTDVYHMAEQAESVRIQLWSTGFDVSDEPRWAAPGVPNFYQCMELAKQHSLCVLDCDAELSVDGRTWHGKVSISNDGLKSFGGAQWSDKVTAKMMAYRNAVKQALVDELAEMKL